MPIFLYSNPDNESEVIEVVQSVHEKHEYIKDGKKWIRVFTIPQASIDTRCDPYSVKDFYKSTDNKRETIGTLQDRSAELSEKRKEKEGFDPNKQKYYEDYKKFRKGKEHPDVRQQKLKNNLSKMGLSVE